MDAVDRQILKELYGLSYKECNEAAKMSKRSGISLCAAAKIINKRKELK